MADQTKPGSDKSDPKPEKVSETPFTPEASPQQQKRDSDAQKAAAAQQPGTAKLPELTLAGTDSRVDKPKAASESTGSWSTQELSKVLKHLESIRSDAERAFNTKSGGERAQGHTYTLLRDKILPELKKEGKIDAEWQLYPSVAQSPADKVGADYLLVNTKTGAFHFLDATLKENKDNVFELRAGGVMVVDNRLFDEFSALKTNEAGAIGEAALKLQDDISAQIETLTKTATPFKLGPDGTPMPSVKQVNEEQAKTEIGQLSAWAEKQAEANPADARLFREMAAVVERSLRQIDKASREIASPKLAESISRATDAEIAKYAFAKYKGQAYAASLGSAKNELHILKDGKMVMPTESGEIHVGGNIAEHLEESWKSLLSEKKLLSQLSNKDLKSMGADTSSFEKLTGEERAEAIYKAYRSQPKFRTEADKLRNTLHSEQQVIKAGGSRGTGIAIINEGILARLKGRPENSLLGIAPKPDAQSVASDKVQTKTAFSDIEKSAAKPIDALADFSNFERYDSNKFNESLSTSMELLLADQDERRQKNPNAADLWTQAERDRFAKLTEAYKDPAHPNHADSIKQLHELLNKKADKAEADAEAAKALLKGNPLFERLTDENRMKDAVKQLSDRSKNIPSEDKEEYLARQIRDAMRKQLGAATNAELPESISKLKIKVVEGTSNSLRVSENGVMEIPAKLLKDNPKKAISEAYAHASGLSMLDILKQDGNEHLTMRSLKPLLSKIAVRAETVAATQEASRTVARPAISADAASSDRKAEMSKQRELVTSWDGENLTFGGEKFNISSELSKLNVERESKLKELETEYEKAKTQAVSNKTNENQQRVTRLEEQLAVERQNAKIAAELHQALSGSRGTEAQNKAQLLVKQATEKAFEEHMSKRGSSGGLSRATAAVLVLSTLTALCVQNSGPARADTYESQFRL